MTVFRGLTFLALAVVLGVPLAPLFFDLASPEAWRWTTADLARVARLMLNTAILAASVVALSVPLGAFIAIALARFQAGGSRWAWVGLGFLIVIPLAILTTSWQAVLSVGRWLPVIGVEAWWDRPWAAGWIPAILIHSVHAIPFVAFFVWSGLRSSPAEPECDFLVHRGPWPTLRSVVLPSLRGSLSAAAVFVALATANEITVTDMVQVSTFAEEVHTQFTLGETEALARAVLLHIPWLAGVWLGVWYGVHRLGDTLPPLASIASRHQLWPAGAKTAWLARALVFLLLAVPLAALLVRLGAVGDSWSLTAGASYFLSEVRVNGGNILVAAGTALATGACLSVSALLLCFLARESKAFRSTLFAAMALAWAMPAPLVGIGFKNGIDWLLTVVDMPLLSRVLYFGPSPAPLVWVAFVRFLPVAVFLLWPSVRSMPKELFEQARLEGRSPITDFHRLVWPVSSSAAWLTTGLVAALCLGEVGASARVETPQWEAFAKLVFDRLHYGVDNSVAALCLAMLALLLPGAILIGLWRGRTL